MKVFVARPVVPGGSGFCHATVGELMMFGSGNKALVGFKSHKGSTALQVVELDENEALELYKQGWASSGFFEGQEHLIDGEAYKTLQELGRIASTFKLGDKVWTAPKGRNMVFNKL